MATSGPEVEALTPADEKTSSTPEKVDSLEKAPKDGIHVGQNPELVPEYDEKEGNMNEVVSSADDLVTQIIKVDDDPSVNPWTFRMLFLGMSPAERVAHCSDPRRCWSLRLWWRPPRDLLLQTAGHLCLAGVLDCHSLCPGGRDVVRHSSPGSDRPLPEPRPIQSEGTRRYCSDGLRSVPVGAGDGSLGRAAVILRRLSQPCSRDLHYLVVAAHRIRHCWFTP
jgi:hypothetical protein